MNISSFDPQRLAMMAKNRAAGLPDATGTGFSLTQALGKANPYMQAGGMLLGGIGAGLEAIEEAKAREQAQKNFEKEMGLKEDEFKFDKMTTTRDQGMQGFGMLAEMRNNAYQSHRKNLFSRAVSKAMGGF